MGVPIVTCNWVLDFLVDRCQIVMMGAMVYSKLTISTKSRPGCCFSPKLFTLYTHYCIFNTDDAVNIKYVDILGLLKEGDETAYRKWSTACWTKERRTTSSSL